MQLGSVILSPMLCSSTAAFPLIRLACLLRRSTLPLRGFSAWRCRRPHPALSESL